MPTLQAPGMQADTLTWALWWAGQGWLVFPLCSPDMEEHTHRGVVCTKDIGKAPLVGRGKDDGSANAEQIKRWWLKWPDANIGGRPPKDHFVVDIDGETDVAFPPTWEHTTGKGRHLLYRQNITKPMNQHSKLWPNVDTRTHEKGYVVLPPSTHVSGAVYTLKVQGYPLVFPAELIPERKRATTKATGADSDVMHLLKLSRDSPELGDEAMAKVAGYIARYVPDIDMYKAILNALNEGLSEPLDTNALEKKTGIWTKHQVIKVEEKASKAADDEGRGWLFEMGGTGYHTPVEKKDTVDYMDWSDFRVSAKGLVIQPDSQTWIVDFHRSDGSTLHNQRLHSSTLASVGRLREWLLNRGMVLHAHQADKRTHHGVRLAKYMQSQEPPVLQSRDYYGWCPETEAFLMPEGEATHEGMRSYTQVYPEDRLLTDAPTLWRFDADLEQARNWLGRLLKLQDEAETVKIGAWLMMLLLRDQWAGRLPGILVEASAGTGKTLFFQLLSKLAGSTNDGEEMTMPTARDMLSGNSSGYVWLDDVEIKPDLEQLIRKAMTQGRVTKKDKDEAGKWYSRPIPLRGSVVISGEGTDMFRQKAMRDRFIDVLFKRNRSADAEALVREDIGRGSGALLIAVLGAAHLLPELESLREGVLERDQQAQTTLRMGARILDCVMGTEDKYSTLIDNWHSGKAIEDDKGQASECVLHVFPTMWNKLGNPTHPGHGNMAYSIWYDEVNRTFWVAGKKLAESWNEQKNVSTRQRQLTSATNIRRELDACDATAAANKKIPGTDQTVSYRQLPERYSNMVVENAGIEQGEATIGDEA